MSYKLAMMSEECYSEAPNNS